MKPRNVLVVVLVLVVVGGASYMAFHGWFSRNDSDLSGSSSPRELNTPAIPSESLSVEEILARPKQGARVQRPVYVATLALKDRTVPLGERLVELKALAELDASVAFDLGQAISGCATGEVGDQALEQLLDEGPGGAHVAGSLLSHEELCAGLTKEDFNYALDLLDSSAAAGLDEAQISYVDNVGTILASRPEYRFDDQRIADYKRKSLSYLNASARGGNNGALARMAQLYDEGGVVAADPVAAARIYREFMSRSGNNSQHHLRYLELLERRAAEAQGQ